MGPRPKRPLFKGTASSGAPPTGGAPPIILSQVYLDGSVYEGPFVKGLKHGFGVETYDAGARSLT